MKAFVNCFVGLTVLEFASAAALAYHGYQYAALFEAICATIQAALTFVVWPLR